MGTENHISVMRVLLGRYTSVPQSLCSKGHFLIEDIPLVSQSLATEETLLVASSCVQGGTEPRQSLYNTAVCARH